MKEPTRKSYTIDQFNKLKRQRTDDSGGGEAKKARLGTTSMNSNMNMAPVPGTPQPGKGYLTTMADELTEKIAEYAYPSNQGPDPDRVVEYEFPRFYTLNKNLRGQFSANHGKRIWPHLKTSLLDRPADIREKRMKRFEAQRPGEPDAFKLLTGRDMGSVFERNVSRVVIQICDIEHMSLHGLTMLMLLSWEVKMEHWAKGRGMNKDDEEFLTMPIDDDAISVSVRVKSNRHVVAGPNGYQNKLALERYITRILKVGSDLRLQFERGASVRGELSVQEAYRTVYALIRNRIVFSRNEAWMEEAWDLVDREFLSPKGFDYQSFTAQLRREKAGRW